MGTIVFDGARAFEGVTPDLDRHCARMVRSIEALGMRSPYSAGELTELSLEGVRKFPNTSALYIRPMAWSEDGFLAPDPNSTQFALSVVDSPLPQPNGFSACLSSFRRPGPEVAPTEAKAACHYTNSGRAEREAKQKGFENAVMLDPLGHGGIVVRTWLPWVLLALSLVLNIFFIAGFFWTQHAMAMWRDPDERLEMLDDRLDLNQSQRGQLKQVIEQLRSKGQARMHGPALPEPCLRREEGLETCQTQEHRCCCGRKQAAAGGA